MHEVHLPEWAVERGRKMNDFSAIDASRAALIVIDMQYAFTELDEVFGKQNALDIIDTVNLPIGTLHDAGAKIIWTRRTVRHDPPLAMPPWRYDISIPKVRMAVETMIAGTRSHGIHARMDMRGGDILIDRYRYSAFICPAGLLKTLLGGMEIDTLVIAGALTNSCCESTARDGNMMGYKIVFLSDATSAITDEEHNAALLNIRLLFGDVRRTQDFKAIIARQQPQSLADETR